MKQNKKHKLIRITTVPLSLNVLLKGQLRFMKDHYEVVAVSSGPAAELKEVESREGVPTIQVEMTRAITPFKDLKAVWQLYRLFKKENPHIVHTHTPKAGTVGMLAAKLAGVPHRLHTVAGLPLLEATGAKRKLLDTVEKFTYSCATKVYPNSKGLYDIIIEQGYIKTKRISTTPSNQNPVIATPNLVGGKLKVIANGSSNGIDTAHFNPEQITQVQKATLKKELAISDSDFVFVFVGRLVGDKGINDLVAAFKKLNSPLRSLSGVEVWRAAGPACRTGRGEEIIHSIRSGSDRHSERSEGVTRQTGGDSKESHSEPQQSWGEGISSRTPKLVLVGPFESELDPLQPETLHQIQNNPHILTVGFQKDVRPYLAISHALAFPSYREGFPNVVMQAGAMGIPAIVTNINGCNEIIEDGKNGLIIPAKAGISSSGDEILTQALLDKMQLLINDTKLYNHLQQNARPMICERYEQKVVWEAILDEYRALDGVDQ